MQRDASLLPAQQIPTQADSNSSPAQDAGCIAILDLFDLRRTMLEYALQDWAQVERLEVISADPRELPENAAELSTVRLVVLNLGANPPQSSIARRYLAEISRTLPNSKLVVLSEMQEFDETDAGLLAQFSAFVPATIQLSLFLQILSFVKAGGTYLPPEIFSKTRQSRRGMEPSGAGLGAAMSCSSQVAANAPCSRHAGGIDSGLTCRQKEVLNLLRQGLSNKSIARALGTSEATIKVHVRQIIRKFGVSNRTQVAITCHNRELHS